MKKIVLVYDNTIKIDSRIKSIIGNKSFADIIFKRKTSFSRLEEITNQVEENIEIIRINDRENFEIIKKFPKDTIFCHLLANYVVTDIDEFKIILKKLKYIKEKMLIYCNDIVGLIFSNKEEYIESLKEYVQTNQLGFATENKIETDIFLDLSKYNNLIMYLSNGFDTRYFNTIQANKYTVTKKSKDKKKIKMEYNYYWLLPEDMRNWMVMPYNYKEEKEYASYTMERMPMTDVAVRWTHGAIDPDEFKNLMDIIFYFFKSRKNRKITKEEYNRLTEELYIKKVEKRIEELKKVDKFKKIEKMIECGTEFNSIDEIIKYYKKIYKHITLKYNKLKYYSVIGHGDVFFANMLYSKEINLLRLIDPKGALEEKDLWTDMYYDIAKLSHSICGNYDFFNVDDYNIEVNNEMKLELKINFNNAIYKEIFKEYLKKEGYEYILVRLYEASLFLSMLPLHMDNPNKVLGYLLNAINILKEVEKNV